MLEVSGLCVGYGKEDVLRDVSFAMSGGEFVCVLGANGCGKTTLLKAILGLLRPSRGRVILSGEEVHRMDVGRLARSVAYIPQAHIPPFPFRVRDVVMMGRTPYLGYLARPTPEDLRIVDDILDVLELGPPERVIREDSMQRIYRTPVRISEVDMGGGSASVCVPRRSPRSPRKRRLKREVPADPAAEHNDRRRRDAS